MGSRTPAGPKRVLPFPVFPVEPKRVIESQGYAASLGRNVKPASPMSRTLLDLFSILSIWNFDVRGILDQVVFSLFF
ncbi:Hypothetical protein NTJ_12168 [Nesidiocoris tenuis]|uniref:Uncharacterized protein n=1 Tax=Nesidiocoris tenuis TaxID=355587 RepID=A0ABN7B4L6_9HEMI|nr:Hypothetical protein NTJ_12168 [Nesidiocoris tenuis]